MLISLLLQKQEKKTRGKERTTPVFQNSLFIGQFTDCFITARGKSKIETTGVSVKWIPINKEL